MRQLEAVRLVMQWCLAMVLAGVALSAAARELPDFTALAEANGPAVVNISTTQKVKRQLPHGLEMPQFPEESPWGDLFRHFFGEGGGPAEEFDTQSLGSGFIIDADGYIVTNYHVVREADEIVVRLNDRRELKAKVVGGDERSDLALLKIDATGLPMVKLGSSASLKVGEWVMAIGSPFGFDHSVSVGVVSAIGRNLPRESYVPFIQTDVAINPGNSGGPLFNLNGEVVGINSQIYSRTGGFMGLSFAIPIDTAVNVVKQLKTKGYVRRGMLGILIQDVDRELAESFGMDKPMGAAVAKVLPDSPAEDAGFKVGDVVVKFDGKDVVYSSDLPVLVGRTEIGKQVAVDVIRGGKNKTLKVKIGELPDKELAEGQEPPAPAESSGNRLGLVVETLGEEQRRQMELEGRGVLVRKVEKGAAADAGVRAGDVILMMDNKDVSDANEFEKIVTGLPENKMVPVLVQRRNSPVFLAMKIDADG